MPTSVIESIRPEAVEGCLRVTRPTVATIAEAAAKGVHHEALQAFYVPEATRQMFEDMGGDAAKSARHAIELLDRTLGEMGVRGLSS